MLPILSFFTAVRPATAQQWTIDAIRYGTIRGFPVSGLVVGAPRGERLDIATVFWLLRDGERVVLLDTGFHRSQWMEQFDVADYMRPDSALMLAGVEAGDVTDVVLTHAHWDHMGGIDLFPDAMLWIQRDEYDYYTGPAWQDGGHHGGIDPADITELVRRNMEGKVRFVHGDDVEILPGIRAYTRGRHTYASQYLRVISGGPWVLASDAVYLYRNLEEKRPIATFEPADSSANLAAQQRMIALAGSPDRVIPGHDPIQFQRFGDGGRVARIHEVASAGAARGPAVHTLPATPETVAWGHYDPSSPPVLRVRSGDIVDMGTLITNSPRRLEAAGVAPEEIEPALRQVYEEVTDRGPGGHILTGPIFVEGAEAGDVLEVRILSVELPIDYGYNGCSGFARDLCEDPRTRILRFDRTSMTSDFGSGITVPLRPFFGSMGVAPPPDSGRVSSTPPGRHAGNIDNRELVAGTSLFIPVHVPGALFEAGDGHAAQGDGEVDQTAIETSLRGRLQLIVHKGRSLEWPRAETPSHYIVMGFDPDLTEATRIAVREMVAFLQEEKGLTRGEAYRLASLAADLHITELVDENVGVHMMIPKSIF
jgi:acetamidase/formamidase